MASKILSELTENILKIISVGGFIFGVALFFYSMNENIQDIKSNQIKIIDRQVKILSFVDQISDGVQDQFKLEDEERKQINIWLNDFTKSMYKLNGTLNEVKFTCRK